ncbi:CTAG/PCC1 family protein ASCRUDRAFT_40196, partial [Ascoidea rubescens DSM 1968]
LNIPFQLQNQASIALKTLSVDPILRPDDAKVSYLISYISNCHYLHIDLYAISDRVLRVLANNIIASLKTIVECFDEF